MFATQKQMHTLCEHTQHCTTADSREKGGIRMNEYLNGLMERVIRRNPAEPEFHQAVREVLSALTPVLEARPEFVTEGVMECLVEPERIIKFRVPWEDD